jgi:uncharacterized membrane protein
MRKGLDIAAISMLVLHAVFTLVTFPSLPDTIPLHFNFSGEADDVGSKVSVWGIWFVSLGLFVMFSSLAHLPLQFWNLPEAAKRDSRGQGKELALELVSSLKVFTAALFWY